MDKKMILLGHGSGGTLSHRLLGELIVPTLSAGQEMNDAALLELGGEKIAFTTDSYVIDPIFFPGGDIGSLAVNGTVNDLAMMGGRPLCLSAAFIIEEGFGMEELERIVASMRRAADAAGVAIVTGDTKVVPRGKGDGIFINTAGVGVVHHPFTLSGSNARPDDCIIVSGTIGDHGIAVLAAREGLEMKTGIASDCAALNGLAEAILAEGGEEVHALRDPTRGGVATTVKEIALQSGMEVLLREEDLPVRREVRGFCEILGLDPLYVANEGKMLVFVSPEAAPRVLERMRRHPLGREAAIIGRVSGRGDGRVHLETGSGGVRAIEMLAGEQLPRIC